MASLISFDIDGTMEFGDPPGGITLDMVRRAKQNGFIIGSCSDRFPSIQRTLWEKHDIVVDFVAPKQGLPEVKGRFEAEKYYHIGDRSTDQQYAERAGFLFFWAIDAVDEPWLDGLEVVEWS